jgi:hypothetical protein
MIAYKLFRKRKDGTYGSLFINRTQRLNSNTWYKSEGHLTPGYSYRQGWHCCLLPEAPHLSEKGRVWCVVQIDDYSALPRPESQGGTWFLADRMKIIQEVYD